MNKLLQFVRRGLIAGKLPFGVAVISNEGIVNKLDRTQEVTFVNEDGLYDVILGVVGKVR